MNVGISVSRVGGNAQTKAMKKVAGMLRLDLAQYRELAAFASFGSDLDKATQAQLTRGERMVELLKQGLYRPEPVEDQVLVLFAGTRGFLDTLAVEEVGVYQKKLVAWTREKYPELLAEVRKKGTIDADMEGRLRKAAEEFAKVFAALPERERTAQVSSGTDQHQGGAG